jgi:hypothetical protein
MRAQIPMLLCALFFFLLPPLQRLPFLVGSGVRAALFPVCRRITHPRSQLRAFSADISMQSLRTCHQLAPQRLCTSMQSEHQPDAASRIQSDKRRLV